MSSPSSLLLSHLGSLGDQKTCARKRDMGVGVYGFPTDGETEVRTGIQGVAEAQRPPPPPAGAPD